MQREKLDLEFGVRETKVSFRDFDSELEQRTAKEAFNSA